jgi:hypothetical protein
MMFSFSVASCNDMDGFTIARIIKQAGFLAPEMERLSLPERARKVPTRGNIAAENKDDLLVPSPGLDHSPPLACLQYPVDEITGMTARLPGAGDVLSRQGYLARDIERVHVRFFIIVVVTLRFLL